MVRLWLSTFDLDKSGEQLAKPFVSHLGLVVRDYVTLRTSRAINEEESPATNNLSSSSSLQVWTLYMCHELVELWLLLLNWVFKFRPELELVELDIVVIGLEYSKSSCLGLTNLIETSFTIVGTWKGSISFALTHPTCTLEQELKLCVATPRECDSQRADQICWNCQLCM